MAKITPTFYILHGEDEYTRKAQVNTMRDEMNDSIGLNISTLDGTQTSAQAVLNTASAIPFLSDKRLVIVEGMLAYLAKKGKSGQPELDILVAGLPNLPDFARVVFHENTTLTNKNPVIKLVHEDPHGFEKAFNAPSDPINWIRRQAENVYQTQIEPAAATALASVIDKDLRAADSELAKLSAYVNGERAITVQDVKLLTPYVSEPDIFKMVDAIGQQDGRTAMTICMELLNDQEALSLFGMINRQFRLLILAREYIDQHGNSAGMADALGIHEFVAKKLGSQARAFGSLEQIEGIYRTLTNYDFSIKTGKVTDVMALQLFIAGVTK